MTSHCCFATLPVKRWRHNRTITRYYQQGIDCHAIGGIATTRSTIMLATIDEPFVPTSISSKLTVSGTNRGSWTRASGRLQFLFLSPGNRLQFAQLLADSYEYERKGKCNRTARRRLTNSRDITSSTFAEIPKTSRLRNWRSSSEFLCRKSWSCGETGGARKKRREYFAENNYTANVSYYLTEMYSGEPRRRRGLSRRVSLD